MPDYRRANTKGGTYFFTVTTHRRQPILTDEPIRAALRESIGNARKRLPFEIVAWVLLPDHLHCIWTLPDGDADFHKRWGMIKRQASQACGRQYNRPEWQNASRLGRSETSLWQRRYWEHQIRDETDMAHHVEYIHWNPVKHGLVRQVSDWPYSTFHKYVSQGAYPMDWAGNIGEKENESRFGE